VPAVLVFGGSGWLGGAVCRALKARGLDPVVADLKPPAGGYEFRSVDVTRIEPVVDVCREVGAVATVNLAYMLAPATEADQLRGQRVNLDGMLHVFEGCRQAGIRRCVFASSIAVYGDQSLFGDRDVNEEDRGWPSMLYGWHKLVNEASAHYFERNHGTECVALRLSTVFGSGPAAINQDLNDLIRNAADGGDVRCSLPAATAFNLLHVNDAADSFVTLAAANACAHRIYNSGGEPYTLPEFAQALERLRPGLNIHLDNPEGVPVPRVVRVNWDRLRGEFNINRPPLLERLRHELQFS
jgi:UDP-glucose 4-epimerase